MEKIITKTDIKKDDKVTVTINVLHNDTGQEFEGIVTKVENNPFRGFVITVDAKEKGIFFDIVDNFRKV